MNYITNTLGDTLGVLLGTVSAVLMSSSFLKLLAVGLYVLESIALSDLAQRRGLRQNWMAWVPLLRLWLVGSLSDQYRYLVRGQIRSSRNWLVVLSIVPALLTLVGGILSASGLLELLMRLPEMDFYGFTDTVLPALPLRLGIFAAAGALRLAGVILRWVCLSDIYGSSRPAYKAIYTLTGILLPFTVPFLLYVCRDKDGGMPPRKEQ